MGADTRDARSLIPAGSGLLRGKGQVATIVLGDPALDSEPQRAIDATRSLLKTVRAVRTYPPGNEIRQRTLAELHPQLEQVLPLELTVTPAGFQIAEQAMPAEEEGRSKVATRLFRDGIRRMELKPGLDAAEAGRLVIVLAENIHPDDLTRDYVTLLWEAGLPHVTVAAVDPFLDLDGEDDVLEGKPPESEAAPRDDPEQDIPPPPNEAFKVSEADSMRLVHEASLVEAGAPWRTFVEALFSILESPIGERRADEIALLIETTYHRSLASSRAEIAAELLERVQAGVPDFASAHVGRMVDRAAAIDHLRPLHAATLAGEVDLEHSRRILELLGPACTEPICRLTQEGSNDEVHSLYADVLTSIGVAVLPHVIPMLDDEDGRALAIAVLARNQHADSARALLLALDRAEHGGKRDLVRALAQQADPAAAGRMLDLALEDEDNGIRIIALRCLDRERHRGGQDRLLKRAQSSTFRIASDEEKDLLFNALGTVSDGKVVPYLERLLKVGLLRRSRPDQWRRAAKSLARVGTADAIAALERGCESRVEDLARFCSESLRETGNRRR